MQKSDSPAGPDLPLTIAIGLFTVIVLLHAWVSNAAFITLRVVANAVSVNGLRWDVAERVQAFVHPAWIAVLALPLAVTREPYYSTLAISAVLTILTALLLVRGIARSAPAALTGILILGGSSAFVDYSTSGFENPLSHALIAAFFACEASGRALALMPVAAGLLALSSPLATLLVLPSLLRALTRRRGARPIVLGLLAGAALPAAWAAFALVYYGTPIPNPVLAWWNAGFTMRERVARGLLYLLNSARTDPLTLGAITAAVAGAAAARDHRPAALGLVVYLIALVSIGGTWMGGRLLSAPLLGAAIVMARWDPPPGRAALLPLAVVALLALMAPHPTLLAGGGRRDAIDAAGIVDERRYSYGATALLAPARTEPGQPPLVTDSIPIVEAGVERGRFSRADAYRSGRAFRSPDPTGTADPLLAWLPAVGAPAAGAMRREAPAGYVDSIRSGRNALRDPPMRLFYEDVRLLARGPLWSAERWRAIARLHRTRRDARLDAWERGLVYATADALTDPKPEGTPWDDPGTVAFDRRGVLVDLGSIVEGRTIELSLDHNDDYRVTGRLGSATAWSDLAPAKRRPRGGLVIHRLAPNAPFDRLEITPRTGDGLFSLGHLRIGS
jgi:arabinofuranosyltransferase